MSAASATAITRCVVVVPAHNERADLPAALDAIDIAARHVRVPVHVVVVLDACDDGSADVVGRRADVRVIGARNVGTARATGFADFGRDADVWFASTDADSRVPADWLVSQLRLAGAGADAVVGTVSPVDWVGWPVETARRFAAHYVARDGHRHIHGANLGVRASIYARVGGFTARTHDEDVDLVHRVIAAGGEVSWSAAAPVSTSTRAQGRAPAGFASALAELVGDAVRATGGSRPSPDAVA